MVGTVEDPLINPDELMGNAQAAMARQDSDEALRLWRTLRREYPERAEGYVLPIHVLRQRGKLAEAEATAAEAFARFPENPEVLVQYGWIATMRQRWDEALRWWEAVRSLAPDRVEGYLWATRALWKLGRLDEAEALAGAALDRFGGDANIRAESAWVAVNRNDWDVALHRWKLVLDIDPGRRDAQIGLIKAMRHLGRVDSAELMASDALARHPSDPDFLIEHIWSAVDRGDWTAAAARLEAAKGALQHAGRLEEIRGAVDARRQAVHDPGDSRVASDRSGAAVDEISVSDLMLSFESIGERCDFGSVQRHFGVEPLGLLRFASCSLDPLLTALADRFEPIGTVEDTVFGLYGEETILTLKKYGIFFHTYVFESELKRRERRDIFQEQQRRRLKFLKRKLIADLEESHKIFVYSSDARVSVADAIRLFTALRAYGPNSLLYVRPAVTEHTLGTVEVLEDGLYLGYYPRLTNFVAGEQPPFQLWRQLCERTYRLSLGSGRGPLQG